MRRSNTFGLTFLDLICSAMGGTVVLAVIFSIIKNPVSIPLGDEFIMFEMKYADNEITAGVQITAPEEKGQWCEAVYSDKELTNSIAGSPVRVWRGATATNGVLFVFLEKPCKGAWRIRPHMSDYSRDDLGGVQIISLRCWTKGGQLEFELPEQKVILGYPGERAQTIQVMIDG